MAKVDSTIYVGRFNPFHLGHAYVLEQALKNSKLVIVLVGSSGQARSLKNPFNFFERRRMILSWWQETMKFEKSADLVILPLHDYPYNDTKWIECVQATVRDAISDHAVKNNIIHADIQLTGSDRDDSTWYLGAFPQWRSALLPEYTRPPDYQVSATSVREILFSEGHKAADAEIKLLSKVPRSTATFLLDFINTKECKDLQREHAFVTAYKKAWSNAPYPPVFVTTDAVLVQSGHVLVVERGAFPGKGLWALPGGFVNQKERLAEGVVRELIEETGIKVPEALLKAAIKMAPKEIFDKPDRSTRGRTITTAFLIRLDDTKPLPKVKGQNAPLHETGGEIIVETTKSFWLPISEALSQTDKWFEDHLSIVEWAVSLLNSR